MRESEIFFDFTAAKRKKKGRPGELWIAGKGDMDRSFRKPWPDGKLV